MYYPSRRARAPLCIVALAALCGAADLHAQAPAKSPLVVAIETTRPSVVAIRHTKAANSKKDTVGTGVIIHPAGYAVTNRHVVGNHKSVYVRLHDGKDYVAHVLKADANMDLALLHIQAQGASLQPMSLDPLDHLWLGEEVIAIGHPYGYTFSVSRGIVSYIGREITMPTGEVLGDLIQTDAAINPGNSGGPLINTAGRLVGINVALRDGAQGIAFAIHVNSVRGFVARHLGPQWASHNEAAGQVASTAPVAAAPTAAKVVLWPKAIGRVEHAPPKSGAADLADTSPPAAPAVMPPEDATRQTAAPAPVNPASHDSSATPPATPDTDSALPTAELSARPLMVALIGLLIIVLCQQYALLRRPAPGELPAEAHGLRMRVAGR
jgi:S1-C subfamily serine protease